MTTSLESFKYIYKYFEATKKKFNVFLIDINIYLFYFNNLFRGFFFVTWNKVGINETLIRNGNLFLS